MTTNYQGGNDVVLNFQPLMNTMARNLQYQQQQALEQRKQKEAVMSQATKELSKVNSNGLWKADLPQFNEQMKNVKDTYFQLGRARDEGERRQLSLDLQTKLQGLDSFVYNSKKVNEDYGRAMNSVKDLVGKGRADEYRTHLSTLTNKPSSDINREVLDSSPYVYTYDHAKVATTVGRLGKTMLGSVTPIPETINTYSTSGGKRYDIIQQSKEVGSVKSFDSLSDLAKRDRNVGAYVNEIMTSQGLDFNGAINALQEEFADNFREVSTKDVPADKSKGQTINIRLSNDPNELQRTIVNNYELGIRPSGTVATLSKYMQFEQPQTIGGLIRATDPITQQNVNLQGSTRTKVVGIGANSKGKEMIVIEQQDPDGFEAPKILLAEKDKYLNRSAFSKRDADYINLFEQEVARGRSSNTSRQTPNPPTQSSSGLSGGNVR